MEKILVRIINAHQKIMHPEYRNIQQKISYSSAPTEVTKAIIRTPKGSSRFCMAAKLPDMEKRNGSQYFYGKVELFVHIYYK
jgi:hypothetical protein